MSDTAIAPDELSVDELGEQIVDLAGRVAAATCRWLLLVAEFDRREGYGHFGLYSTARWLSHHCGIAHRTALEHVRVAHALAPLRKVGGGDERRPAVLHPDTSNHPGTPRRRTTGHRGPHRDRPTRIGRTTGNRGARPTHRRGRAAPPRRGRHGEAAAEYVRFGWTDTSHGTLGARLLPERTELRHAAVRELARAEQISQADALVRIAEIAPASINDDHSAVRPLRGDERAAIIVHIHAPASPARGTPDAPRSAERDPQPDNEPAADEPAGRIADGPGLPAAVVERLLCSARIRAVLHGAEGNVRDLGRSRRLVSKRLFAALLARDRHCRHPGCTSTSGLDAHHIVFWSRGGPTDLQNLILLCAAHHHRLHDGATIITRTSDDRLLFTRPDGTRPDGTALPDRPDLHPPATDPWAIDRDHDTEPTAARSHWNGQHLDRHYAISVLATRRDEAARLARAG